MNKKDDNVHNSDHTEKNHNELTSTTDNTSDNIPTEYIAQRSIGTVYNTENQPEYYEYEYNDRDFFAVPGDNKQNDSPNDQPEESKENEDDDYNVYRVLNNYKILSGMLTGFILIILLIIAFSIHQSIGNDNTTDSSVPTRTTTTTLPMDGTSDGGYNHKHRSNNPNVQIIPTYNKQAEESPSSPISTTTSNENTSVENTTHAHTETTHETTEDISTHQQTSYVPTSTRENVPVIPSMPSLPNVSTMTPRVPPTVTHTAPHNENRIEENIGDNNGNDNAPGYLKNDSSND